MELFTDTINGTPSPSFLRKETVSWKSVSPVHFTIYPKKGSTLVLCGTLYVTSSLLFFVRDESREKNLKKRRRSSLLASLGFFRKQESNDRISISDQNSLRRSITSSVSNGSNQPLLLERIKSTPIDTSSAISPLTLRGLPLTAVRIPLVALDNVTTSKTFSAINLKVAIKKRFLSSSHLLAASVIPIADVVVEFKHPFLHGEAGIFMQKVKAAMKAPVVKISTTEKVKVTTKNPIAIKILPATKKVAMSQAIGKTALAYARVWHLVDARERILGRMSTSIATTLMGKHKPIYDPASDCGDYVVVINAEKIRVTGRKADQKLYRHHSGYPGGLKEVPYKRLLENKPEEIIQKAVSGMLPKNRLRAKRLERLLVFEGEDHPYAENIIKRYDDGTFTTTTIPPATA